MIKTVIKIQSDGVMVFDDGGEQIPKYQGNYEEVRESILRDATPGAMFFTGLIMVKNRRRFQEPAGKNDEL